MSGFDTELLEQLRAEAIATACELLDIRVSRVWHYRLVLPLTTGPSARP